MNGFVPGPHEPGLEHFTQWLDQQLRRSPDARAGMLGALLGTAWGFCGAGVGVLVGGFQLSPYWALLPLLFGLGATAYGLAWYFRGRSEEERAMIRIYSESRGLLSRLQTARWRSQLRTLLGSSAVEILDEGARHWGRATSAFASPLWNASAAGSSHLAARDHAHQAMDSAMARLALLAGIGGYNEGPHGPAHKLVADMKQMADEAQSLIEKLGERTFVDSGESSRDLRAALGELRLLSEAESELNELKTKDT